MINKEAQAIVRKINSVSPNENKHENINNVSHYSNTEPDEKLSTKRSKNKFIREAVTPTDLE